MMFVSLSPVVAIKDSVESSPDITSKFASVPSP